MKYYQKKGVGEMGEGTLIFAVLKKRGGVSLNFTCSKFGMYFRCHSVFVVTLEVGTQFQVILWVGGY